MNLVTKKLFSLYMRNFTGIVEVKNDTLVRKIYFRKGTAVFAESNVREETLGHMLLSKEKITQEQYISLLETMKTTQKLQGEVVVEQGILTAYEVYEFLREQVKFRFLNCFAVDDGDLTIHEGDQHLVGIAEFPIDMARVMIDTFSFEVGLGLKPNISNSHTVRLTAAGVEFLKKLQLHPDEQKVVRLMNGQVALENILLNTGIEGENFLYSLLGLKFASHFPPREKGAEVSDVPSQASVHEARKTVVIEDKKPSSPIYSWGIKASKPLNELLSITPTMTRFQIRKAYDAKVKELGLDDIQKNYKGEELEIAERVLDRLTLAVTVFSDEKKRSDYVSSLRSTGEESFSPAVNAEVCSQKASMMIVKKQFDQAERELQKAITLMPNEASYHAEMADLLLKMNAGKDDKTPITIKEFALKAIELNDKCDEAHFALGTYYKILGDSKKSLDAFSRLLEYKPNHARAQSEVRLIRMRKGSEDKKETKIFGLSLSSPSKAKETTGETKIFGITLGKKKDGAAESSKPNKDTTKSPKKP